MSQRQEIAFEYCACIAVFAILISAGFFSLMHHFVTWLGWI